MVLVQVPPVISLVDDVCQVTLTDALCQPRLTRNVNRTAEKLPYPGDRGPYWTASRRPTCPRVGVPAVVWAVLCFAVAAVFTVVFRTGP